MFDVNQIVASGGILLIALIIFSESGLLIGFFLPGDTLLIAAGLFASSGKLSMAILLPVVTLSAIIGYHVGYIIGKRAGPRFFTRKGGVLLREDYVVKTEEFLKKHGGKTVFLARFVPIVRTVVSLVAGIGKMPVGKFTLYNIFGGAVWVCGVTTAAYWIGNSFPNLDAYIIWLMLAAMVLTTGSMLVSLTKKPATRRALAVAMREEWDYLFNKNKKNIS